MKSISKMAALAIGLAGLAGAPINASQQTPTAQTQPNMDKRDEEIKQITPESGTRRGRIHHHFGRLSGPSGRFLNQRQRRKLEAQTGRKRKR